MKRLIVSIFILVIAMAASAVLSQATPPVKEVKTNIDSGFGGLQWGIGINDAKANVQGKIVYTDEKRKIISRDGDIEYLYGFFYADPALAQAEQSEDMAESSLFYVSVRFPYITKGDVQKKIEDKYGEPTGEDLVRNQGAVIWDSEKTTIIMWVDNYEDMPFCKKINYVSREYSGKINDYQKRVFNRQEIEILKRLSL